MPFLRQILVGSPLPTSPPSLTKRINIPITTTSPPGLVAASKQDPWNKSGKYALGWVYFSIILLVLTMAIHYYHYWNDKIGRAEYKEEIAKSSKTSSPDDDYEMANMPTNNSSRRFFPETEKPSRIIQVNEGAESSMISFSPLNKAIALVRFVMYRPMPTIRYKRREFSLPGAGASCIVLAALAFVMCYCFIPQPLFYSSIGFGSPPLAIRAGMLAVAMMPWIVALSMKANFITWVTGIGHERLNVLHRWAAYLCLALSVVHTVPFYITPVWDQGALNTFKTLFTGQYIYGTGWAALVPLCVLVVHSLPFVRAWMYELFVWTHVPISIVFLGMLFWHCHNYLTSWNYLWATAAIWLASYITRVAYLNWLTPWRESWLIGEESAITMLPENAIKVTIPTKKRWTPGQYAYLRIPAISIFENHPFTIASLNSEDFPSEYGEGYRDMTLVFRPFGGFTRKVYETAEKNLYNPDKTYQAFIDGPYGGIRRDLASFDTVILFAGGSGITAIVSHLLSLIHKMRESKAVTKQVHVIWALKRPETLEWFKEELRICKESAPPESVHCQFHITAVKRPDGQRKFPPSPSRPLTDALHQRVEKAFDGLASKRSSAIVEKEKRHSALIHEAAAGDPEKEREYRAENEDSISSLPHPTFLPPPKKAHTRNKPSLTIPTSNLAPPAPIENARGGGGGNFDFGFPSTPTMLQKTLIKFAFQPLSQPVKRSSWHTEYGRPDIPFLLKDMERGFGRKTAVFVCGPPSLRVDVQRSVAGMQRGVWQGKGGREEVYLHTENYAI